MPPLTDIMGWIAYAAAWLAATLFWTLASASGAGRAPAETLPYAFLTMVPAALMGVGVWHLTRRVPWDFRAPSFYAIHGLGLVAYSVLYATSWAWPDLFTGRVAEALAAFRASPFVMWNLLMGSWLYLIVAGISYAVRGRREVREKEAAAAEARILARDAQLAALRAQINPHFLFNALHSVGALVTTDPKQADRALESLGDLLRYALGAEAQVLFAQEWSFTKDYLAFEQLRLGERLRLDVQADASASSVMVPPLILQPLVENAVRHGIADRPEGGEIRLRAGVEDARLILRVSDDGGGDSPETSDGLGLSSVRRRLDALYGDRASVVTERTTRGFSVIVDLPATHSASGTE
jgi:LytS/YehU family sensor histidine kinase